MGKYHYCGEIVDAWKWDGTQEMLNEMVRHNIGDYHKYSLKNGRTCIRLIRPWGAGHNVEIAPEHWVVKWPDGSWSNEGRLAGKELFAVNEFKPPASPFTMTMTVDMFNEISAAAIGQDDAPVVTVVPPDANDWYDQLQELRQLIPHFLPLALCPNSAGPRERFWDVVKVCDSVDYGSCVIGRGETIGEAISNAMQKYKSEPATIHRV